MDNDSGTDVSGFENPYEPPSQDAQEPLHGLSAAMTGEQFVFPFWAQLLVPAVSMLSATVALGLFVLVAGTAYQTLYRTISFGDLFGAFFGIAVIGSIIVGLVLFSVKGFQLSRHRTDRFQFLGDALWLNGREYPVAELELRATFVNVYYLQFRGTRILVLDKDLPSFKSFERKLPVIRRRKRTTSR